MGILSLFKRKKKTAISEEFVFSYNEPMVFVDENRDSMYGPAYVDGVNVPNIAPVLRNSVFRIDLLNGKKAGYRLTLEDVPAEVQLYQIDDAFLEIGCIINSEEPFLEMRTEKGFFGPDKVYLATQF